MYVEKLDREKERSGREGTGNQSYRQTDSQTEELKKRGCKKERKKWKIKQWQVKTLTDKQI